jgi:hypothetical protein
VKANLLHRTHDFDWSAPPPPLSTDLTQDLALETLVAAMAQGDAFVADVVRRVLLAGLSLPEDIRYRQDALRDCRSQLSIVKQIYDTAVEAVGGERRIYRSFMNSPGSVLFRAIQVHQLFDGLLKRLRHLADENYERFRSDAFSGFFATIRANLDDQYFSESEEHLRTLRFKEGMLISARLGPGNKGAGFVLRKLERAKRSWWRRLGFGAESRFTIVIAPQDEGGIRALSDLRDRGVNEAANALAQAADHVLSFFAMVRAELAFYIGCLNLLSVLTDKGEPTCQPEPLPAGEPFLSARGLIDPCLSLSLGTRVVGNDVEADGKPLLLVTGANQGGKSTFLRSLALAQLMMQCGMPVAADAFRANITPRVYTHFRRQEDAMMESGKLDEELVRMSEIVDHLSPNDLVLFNESFAATNEREGADIASEIIESLLDRNIKVYFVTHSFELAHRWYVGSARPAKFLRAGRREDGSRPFKIIEGAPESTSHGEDLYDRIFADPPVR